MATSIFNGPFKFQADVELERLDLFYKNPDLVIVPDEFEAEVTTFIPGTDTYYYASRLFTITTILDDIDMME
jgi:hypothetical protein